MKSFKLCRVIYEFPPKTGGSITHTIELAKHMASYCERQVFIVPKVKDNTRELDASFPFEVRRVKYHEFKNLQYLKSHYFGWLPVNPLIDISFGIAVIKEILRLNRKYNFDLIHSHGCNPATTIAGKLIRKPTIWMMHGTNNAYSRIAGFYETLITLSFKPDHLLVLNDGSPAPAKFHNLIRKDDKITTVYHGIDTQIFIAQNRNKQLAESIGINDKFVIMGIQSLIPVKNIEYSIKIFAEFLKQNKIDDAKLVLVGNGPLRNSLEQLSIHLDLQEKIIFAGEIANSEIAKYLSLADVVIATSLYSNMNRSVQEAMACCKPVVAFNSGGTGTTIIDGDTGLLVKSGDIEGFSSTLMKLYKDPGFRKLLGENARNFIMKNRSWKSRIDIELAVYNNLLKK